MDERYYKSKDEYNVRVQETKIMGGLPSIFRLYMEEDDKEIELFQTFDCDYHFITGTTCNVNRHFCGIDYLSEVTDDIVLRELNIPGDKSSYTSCPLLCEHRINKYKDQLKYYEEHGLTNLEEYQLLKTILGDIV